MSNLQAATPKRATLTLNDLEDMEKGPIYVLNNTRQPEQGEVSFTVPKLGQSGVDNVVIPSTFIPIDLMEQVSRKQLMESSEFKRSIRGKVLVLITKEYAHELLQDPEAEYEAERIFNKSQATMNMAQSIEGMQTGDMLHPELARRDIRNADNDVIEGIMPKVAAVIATLQEEGDERGAISSLRMAESNMTDMDFAYVVKQCGSKFNILKEWARKRLEA